MIGCRLPPLESVSPFSTMLLVDAAEEEDTGDVPLAGLWPGGTPPVGDCNGN